MSKNLRVRLRGIVDNSYDIVIGMELRNIPREISRQSPHALKIVITDSHIHRFYGNCFKKPGFRTLVVPWGEQSKSRSTKNKLEDKLLSLKAGRDSLIIALGGGMIGDVAGFVAATYLRGIPYIQIPTSLLAQVDSSIGGKVAIDHPLGKNLIGAFHQPKKVYIDVSTLKTLPDREFRNGMAEIIKYAAIMDGNLFDYLEDNISSIQSKRPSLLTKIIRRCCELKKFVVEKDEREANLRRILNFGHTIGHAVESLSKYRVSHGEAVAIGMVAEAKISCNLGLISRQAVERLSSLIQKYDLPTEIPSTINTASVLRATLNDKKVKDGNVQYTLLERLGKARVGVGIPLKEARRMLS